MKLFARRFLCLLALTLLANGDTTVRAQEELSVSAQARDTKDAVGDVARTLDQLTMELSVVREKFGDSHPNVRQLEQRMQLLQIHLEDRLKAERRVQEVHARLLEQQLRERIAELDARRDLLEAQSEDIRATESEIVMSPDALKLMAQRIGEAQIENRLRELEAKALIEAMSATLKSVKRTPAEETEILVAKQLLETHRAQLQRVNQLAKKNVVAASEVSEAEVQVLMAEAALQQRLSQSNGQAQINAKIAEAATQRAVSIAMQKLLVSEAKRINELLKKSADSQAVESEAALVAQTVNTLKQQLMEVGIHAALQSKELTRLNLLLDQAKKLQADPKPRASGKAESGK